MPLVATNGMHRPLVMSIDALAAVCCPRSVTPGGLSAASTLSPRDSIA